MFHFGIEEKPSLLMLVIRTDVTPSIGLYNSATVNSQLTSLPYETQLCTHLFQLIGDRLQLEFKWLNCDFLLHNF